MSTYFHGRVLGALKKKSKKAGNEKVRIWEFPHNYGFYKFCGNFGFLIEASSIFVSVQMYAN